MDFPFVPASLPSLLAFTAILAFNLVLLGLGLLKAYRKFDPETAARKTQVIMFWVVVWLIAFSGAVATGYAREVPYPTIPMLFLTVILTSLAFAFSPVGRILSYGLPVSALVLFQAFRIPLELVLHEWVSQGVIPKTMTWTGMNYDILAGSVALIAFPFSARFPLIARAANIIGFASLLNVMRVALFSSPIPIAWDVEPKLQLITHLPYALIGPVCVGGALIGHVLLARALFIPSKVKASIEAL